MRNKQKAARTFDFLFIVPLLLSAFTHLWNPTGFPSFYVDEGHYMRRAMEVLEGDGHQESSNAFNGYHPYDHPYLGQILLAFMLKIAAYPTSPASISADESSIQTLHQVPRIFMGILAIIDTALIYKITSFRYNRGLALAASVLFAVMPMTWLLRRILLESLLLPFVLSAVLFAIQYNVYTKRYDKYNQRMLLPFLSGVFLGLAIFIKVPSFTFIPLVGYLVFTSSNGNNKWKILTIWLIPVILVPAIWPTYSIIYGQFEQWVEGISSQANREPRSLLDSIKSVFTIDPIMVTLGMLGIVWATTRRDFFLVFWILPYLIFVALIGYSQYIHMVLLLPVLSIATAILIRDLSTMLAAIMVKLPNYLGAVLTMFRGLITRTNPTKYNQDMRSFLSRTTHSESLNSRLISGLIFIVISTFGLISTATLITTNVNATLFEAYSAFVKYLPSGKDYSEGDRVTLSSAVKWGTYFYWVPKYIFDKELIFLDEDSKQAPLTKKVIYIGGKNDNENYNLTGISVIARIDNIARHFDYTKYPYENMRYNELGNLDVKANY